MDTLQKKTVLLAASAALGFGCFVGTPSYAAPIDAIQAVKTVKMDITGVIKEQLDDKVAVDSVFKDIPVPKRRFAEEGDDGQHRWLYPSMSFLDFFQPYVLRVGDVSFLQDNAKNLIRLHPDCRLIPGTESANTAKIACSRVSQFMAEGDEVIFNYALVNEVIVGGIYSFTTKRRAKQFAEMVSGTLKASQEVVVYQPDRESTVYDSPLFSISLQPGQNGYMVVIDAHHQDRMADIEEYTKEKLELIEFGEMTVGKTRITDLPRPDDLPKVCNDVSEDRESTERREYYGLCFGFPYEAHMQFDFNPVTGIMRSAVLSPIGTATGKIVNDMLTRRYKLASSCRKVNTDQELTPIRRDNTRRSRKGRTKLMRNSSAFVYAGTCENPIIYTTDMRFVFENRYLNAEDIEADFSHRKDMVESAADSRQEYASRMDKMKGFFQ